ncbi:MAG TPA: CheR family methyltransferase [Candidimonas sp.]|nr:CheR family methyltransferase [Candidimonas sp.]
MKMDGLDKGAVQEPGHHDGLDFQVVGLGASAGGIQALVRFFEHMPTDCGMAFVVVVHLSPKFKSHVDEILRRVTKIPAMQVRATTHIEKNHIYIIPPAMDLQMRDGCLQVRTAQRASERPVVIDIFFRTLADAHKGRAVGIVLSGTGADGSVGMARIKEQGGVGIAQLPEDAEFDGMPRSAIESNVVDFIMPVADMPQKLLELARNAALMEIPDAEVVPAVATSPDTPERAQAAEAALADVLRLLSLRTGHDFKHYKRATVLRRLERRMQVSGARDLPEYLAYLEKNPDETAALLDDMLIGVTNFFRDIEAFNALEREVVPAMIEEARKASVTELRVWAPACSTGEEAYSLAMVLTGEAERQKADVRIQVFATDVDEAAIAVARKAIYPASIVTDVPTVYLRQFFTKEETRYRISKRIRDHVLFATHNVLHDPPFSRVQLISCRNLLIYLDRRAQAQVLRIFHSVLLPGGYLFLGASETVDAVEDMFTVVDKKHRIYRSLPPAIGERPASILRKLISMPPWQPVPARSADRAPVSYSALHQRALEKYGPATALIDRAFRIVHMSYSAGRFLRHVGGEPSHNILSLVYPELRFDLRAAISEAIKTARPVQTRLLAIRQKDNNTDARITVTPLGDLDRNEGIMLLLFEESEPAATLADMGRADGMLKAGTVERLKQEIHMLRRELQQTIEYSDRSTEELKASNEEFQAINEELRSATEELETSKEELESINEELITVNFELKTKVEETVKINDDLQNLISSSDIATIFVDRSMRVKWFTPKSASLFNLIPEDRGRLLTDITHRLEYPAMIDDAASSFNSLRLIEHEVRSKDGRWYLARLLPYRTAEDRIEGAVLNFVDITARRVAEDRLRQGLERLRLVAESTKDFAIITTDESGRITSWNRAAEIMFGYQAAEVEGQTLDFIFTPEDRAAGVPAQELRTARHRGHAADDRWHMRKDGSRFYCSGMVYPMFDEGLRGYAKIARDLTDKRIEEDEQQSDLERTKALNLLKDEFIAVMSHELRHPLNLIQLHMDLLSRTPGVVGSEKAVKAIEAVRQSVHNQSQIIADLLDLSRVQTGKLKLECAPIRLVPLVTTIMDAVSSQAQEANVALTASGLDDKDELVVNGDVTRIEQIVWNLLNNAVKFTPAGGKVSVRLSSEDTEARLDVTDTGIGIAPEWLHKVFTMFGQVDRQHNSNKHGLGIGLALVAQLAEAHGGRVSATSEGEGHGATFSLWLPLAGEGADVVQKSAPASSGLLAGLRLLLVDDSKEVLDMLGALCEMEGASVAMSASAPDALTRLASEDYDVLVSDIGMPGMSGYELLTRLRQSGRNSDIPAIALSGYGYSEKADVVGFNDQLCKPVPMSELLTKICAITGRSFT